MVDITGTAYLAAACFNKSFEATLGYYIFSTSVASFPNLYDLNLSYAGSSFSEPVANALLQPARLRHVCDQIDGAARQADAVALVSPAGIPNGQNTVSGSDAWR